MRYNSRADEKPGSMLFLFLPFMLGFGLSRFFEINVEDNICYLAAVSLYFIMFAGASLYGRVTLAAAFVILGSCASTVMSGFSFLALVEHRLWKKVLFLIPLFVGVFCSAYLGLRGSLCLSVRRFPSAGSRMKESIATSLIQGLMLLATAILVFILKP